MTLQASPAAAASCTVGASSDFNGDGISDTAVSDPTATVGGVARAGLVRVILGGGKGVSEISQATAGMNAAAEQGDQFGYSLATFDADGDACADLVVGVPYEDIAKDGTELRDAGAVYVIHGTPSGIGAGSKIDGFTQYQFDSSTATEAYDRFGFALQSGTTASDAPYLAIGVPGENVTSGGKDYVEAGCIHYMQGTAKYTVNQDDPGVPGVVEAHDEFGYSLAGTNRYFAVGAPGETIGDDASFAGAVTVFNHAITSGVPTGLVGLDQGALDDGLAGGAEANDQFGTSIDMTNYRPGDQTYNSDALLAVGAPGEAIGTAAGAGIATVVRVQPSGTVSELGAIDAGTTDVDGDPTAGDYFGQRVTIANTDTSVVSSATTIRLAVGIPGRDIGSAKDAGAVQVFRPLDSAIGTNDKIISRAASGSVLPGTATERDNTGISLASGSANLYVGVPYSKEPATSKGVLYVIPWTDIAGTTSTGTTTLKPGAGGIPDAGTAFGVVR